MLLHFRALGEHCHFGADNTDMIRDRFVCGVNDINIQRPYQRHTPATVHTIVVEKVSPTLPSDLVDQSNPITFPIYNIPHKANPLETEVYINNKLVVMEIDTGAGLSIINQETYNNNLSNYQLQPTDIQLCTYGGQPITVLGLLNVTVKYESQSAKLPLVVVTEEGSNLLGRNWLSTIKLNWKTICHLNISSALNEILEKHNNVFKDEVGLLKGTKAMIHTTENATPRFFKPRSLLYYLKEKVKQELTKLQQQGIITSVKFSDWAAPIVPVIKPDGHI